MKNYRRVSLITTLAILGIVAYSQANTALSQTTLQKRIVSRGWGVSLTTERPFNPAGSAVRATYVISNSSGQDAHGWTNSIGSHGCTYAFTIVNATGQTVWEPGRIERREYFPQVCASAIGEVSLGSGTTLQNSETIPLIYQNGKGVGVQGAALEPGSYQLCIRVVFNGPHHAAGPMGPGSGYSACVPIRIEP